MNKNSDKKIIETINYKGRYVDVTTVRNKLISASIAFLALVSVGIILFF